MLVYLVINAVLVAAWWLGGGGFCWPVFLMTVWGAGVLVNAYLAYHPHPGEDSRGPAAGARFRGLARRARAPEALRLGSTKRSGDPPFRAAAACPREAR